MAQKMIKVVQNSVSQWVFVSRRDFKCMLELSGPILMFWKKNWSWATSVLNIDDFYGEFQVNFKNNLSSTT